MFSQLIVGRSRHRPTCFDGCLGEGRFDRALKLTHLLIGCKQIALIGGALVCVDKR